MMYVNTSPKYLTDQKIGKITKLFVKLTYLF